MKTNLNKKIITLLVLASIVFISSCKQEKSPQSADKKTEFTLAVSIYAGWMPWYYANESGILAKWAEKNGIEIAVQYMDYIPSVEAFVAEKADACVMTNMEALNMPAASGIDSTAIIIGDYSNGNDAILSREIGEVSGLRGEEILLVELSVSHYLLSRALEQNSIQEKEVQIRNISDSDIAPAFLENKAQKAVVTWNPMVLQIQQQNGVERIFDSSNIPGEILDLCVVNSTVLAANPEFARALVGAWYETLALMNGADEKAETALAAMAKSAGCSLTEYKAQLRTTKMFWTATEAADYAQSADLQKNMEFVRDFCFRQGLLGENATSADTVGIAYPGGSIQGDKNNVKLRFSNQFLPQN